MLTKQDCLYQPYYCEENIWQLCQKDYFKGREVKVLFLLPTEANYIALWHQKLTDPDQPVFWDYHVILFDVTNLQIFDFDTHLTFPFNAKSYFTLSFGIEYPKYLPRFKVFDKDPFVENFSSDRSHMLDDRGRWLAEPPAWPFILNEQGVSLKNILFEEKSPFSTNYSFYEMQAET